MRSCYIYNSLENLLQNKVFIHLLRYKFVFSLSTLTVLGSSFSRLLAQPYITRCDAVVGTYEDILRVDYTFNCATNQNQRGKRHKVNLD